jgi:hypothetical protein
LYKSNEKTENSLSTILYPVTKTQTSSTSIFILHPVKYGYALLFVIITIKIIISLMALEEKPIELSISYTIFERLFTT